MGAAGGRSVRKVFWEEGVRCGVSIGVCLFKKCGEASKDRVFMLFGHWRRS